MSHPLPAIDPDITKASTFAAWAYGDEQIYKLALDRIFRPSWQFVGDGESIKAPQHVQPLTILEGSLDEPILLTRDERDRVHCLSNVCTHRGNLVCAHAGREAHLRCAYHGRRFDLDGTFRHMPEFEGVCGFPSDRDNLTKIRFETWGDFLFATIGGTAPLDSVLGPMKKRLAWLPLQEFRFDATRSKDYLVRANWALYCENYLEGFHIPFVHASLNAALDYGTYATELYDRSNLQLGIAKGGDEAFNVPESSPDFAGQGQGRRIAAYYYWLWPNTMFNFYPWGLSINIVRPLGPTLTKVSFLTYVWDESRLERGAGAGLDRVEREDEAIVEAVQRGLRTRAAGGYERGRYSPKREQGVHQFHRLLTAAINGEDAG